MAIGQLLDYQYVKAASSTSARCCPTPPPQAAIVAGGASVLLALLLPTSSQASATRPAAAVKALCSRLGNPYQSKDSVLTACGYQLFPRRAVRVLPGGGMSYLYQVGGGTLTYNIPPRASTR